ncbi:MAG TPA: hypothetical protein VNE42_03440 [Acidimicrobiales bacterium]|nr:hypothetical protein [Acidimicrobiales bacterium]
MFYRTRRHFPDLVPPNAAPSARSETQINPSVHTAQFVAFTTGPEIEYLREKQVPFDMTDAIGSLVSFHRYLTDIETAMEGKS